MLKLDQELLDGIKSIVREVVREEISGVKKDVNSLKGDVSSLKSDVSSLKSDFSSLKKDVSSLKRDVSFLKSDVDSLKNDVSSLKDDVAEMKPQLEENTQLIKTLIARTEANGAKIDQLDHRMAGLEGSEKRHNQLEDEFYHHRHKIIIETGEAEIKAG